MRRLPPLLLAIVCYLAPTVALATFEEGHDAFTQGKYEVAMEHWSAAASSGDTRAINNLGYMYANGIHVPRDLAKAVSLYRQAIDINRDPYAMTNLGWALLNGFGADQDVAKGIELVQEAADKHQVPLARLYLGRAYAAGMGVSVNERAACENFIAASADLPDAVGTAAVCVEEGVGATRDVSRAMTMYRTAIKELNDTGSMVNLARLTLDGTDTKEYPDAVRLLERAADLNHPGAPALLGDVYLYGKGVSVDPVRAVQLYEDALKRFDAVARSKSGIGPAEIEKFVARVQANLEIAKRREIDDVASQAVPTPVSVKPDVDPNATNLIEPPEPRLVTDPYTGETFEISPEIDALFTPLRVRPKPEEVAPPAASEPMTPERLAMARPQKGTGSVQSPQGRASIGLSRFAVGAAASFMSALVGTLLGYAISRLLRRSSAAWPVVIGAFVSCWLLATILHVMFGERLLSNPPNGLGVVAALAVVTALVFVVFGRGMVSATGNNRADFDAAPGGTILGDQAPQRGPAATSVTTLAKVLSTIAVLIVVGIWREVERDSGYPLGIVGSILRGVAAFVVLAWIWGLTALIGSRGAGQSGNRSQVVTSGSPGSPVDHPGAPISAQEADDGAICRPSDATARNDRDGIGYAESTRWEPAAGMGTPEPGNQPGRGPIAHELAGLAQGATPSTALSADTEDALYEKAWKEISLGTPVAAMWARAYAEADGDEAKAKAAYIRLRVASRHPRRQGTN